MLFDQGGNLWEWTEHMAGPNRLVRGGSFGAQPEFELSVGGWDGFDPPGGTADAGFRVAASLVPEPGPSILVAIGFAGLAARGRSARGSTA